MRATSRPRSGSLNGSRSRSRIYALQWPRDICLCREKALESVSDLVSHVESRDNVQAVEQSIRTSLNALKNHNVYVRETFLGSYDMDQIFSTSLENCVNVDLETLKQRMEKGESRESVERELLDEEHFDRWYETLLKDMAGKTDGQKIQK